MLRIILVLVSLQSVVLMACSNTPRQTPVEKHGKLQVIDRQLCDKNGEAVQLKGVSSHGLFWFSQCYNTHAVRHLARGWGVNAIRLAMYPTGYLDNPYYYHIMMEQLIDEAGELGIYCIIDWHVLDKGNPMDRIEEASKFWEKMSAKYSGKDHVIYEICNEPNRVEWEEVKKYSNIIIPLIRKNDKNTVILAGTPRWSSDLQSAIDDPLDYENIMYSFHFYSKSHKNREPFLEATKHIPIFVSEWGTSSSSGDDGNDYESAEVWLNIFDGNNPGNVSISWMNWSYCDKNESSAVLLPGSCIDLHWDNTTESGEWIRNKIQTERKTD